MRRGLEDGSRGNKFQGEEEGCQCSTIGTAGEEEWRGEDMQAGLIDENNTGSRNWELASSLGESRMEKGY